LRGLEARGYLLGIVSNTPWGTPDYLWQNQLARFGLTPHFAVACFSSGVGFRKPDVRIFQVALGRLGVPAARTLFVGDNPAADIAGAQQAGMHTALLLRPGQPRLPGDASPDLRISSLTELFDHLRR
jgi:putative hydrolase of the HAD superfamily